MLSQGKREGILLLIGDIAILLLSLWITLGFRYQSLPTPELFYLHLVPFSLIFIAWFIIFFIAGLYEKQSVFWQRKLPSRLIRAQLINTGIATAFFYLIPFFLISPKFFLFMYVIISFALLFFWRMVIAPLFTPRRKQRALLIASGEEMQNLLQEVNNNLRYGLTFVSVINLDETDTEFLKEKISAVIAQEKIQVVVIDLYHDKIQSILSALYRYIFSRVIFVNFNRLYEELFDRIPLSVVTHSWFLENVSLRPKAVYDTFKRVMDIVISGILFIFSLPFYVITFVLIKLEDRGSLFIVQERIGKNDQMIKILKFRTMTTNDQGDYASEKAQNNKVTKVGNFLRQSRIDELPQLWNVLKGDVSLIGPRPELPGLVKLYEKEISYYNTRHLIKPGLSGWAQIYGRHGHHAIALEETKEKLSYDLFYVKNRSFILDIMIALKTIRTLLSRSGI